MIYWRRPYLKPIGLWCKNYLKNDKKYYNIIMKIYCEYNLFWIKWAKSESLNSFLSSVIAFSRKKVCCNFSPKPHDGFSWDKVKVVPNLCSCGSKSCNFKVFMCKYLFHDNNWFFCNNFFYFFEVLGFLGWKRYLYIKTLKLQLLDP